MAATARALLAGAFILAFAAADAHAQKPDGKPSFAAAGKAHTVEAFIDPRLAAYPRLLQSVEAEARAFVQEAHADTEAEWREDPALFRNDWFFERRYRLRAAAGRHVSVTVSHAEYTGGAHPNSVLDSFLWDDAAKKRVGLAVLFRELRDGGPTLGALAEIVRGELAAEKRRRGAEVAADPARDEWLQAVKAEADALGAASLAPSTVPGKFSGITFTFSPYAVGSYAEGYYTAFVPAATLKPHLADHAQALFGGQRPPDDDPLE